MFKGATRSPTGFGKLEYEERLKSQGLTTLKERRLKGDLIEMYKILSSWESIEWVKPLNLRRNVDISGPAVKVRGNSRRESFGSRIRNSFCSCAIIKNNFFVNRIVQTWKLLPNTIVTSPSLNSFESSIDGDFKRFGCYSF